MKKLILALWLFAPMLVAAFNPPIVVDSPVAGSVLTPGSRVRIHWSGPRGGIQPTGENINYGIVTTDVNGVAMGNITPPTSVLQDTSYDWTVGDIYYGNQLTRMSNGPFRIQVTPKVYGNDPGDAPSGILTIQYPPEEPMRVFSPTAGQVFHNGETMNIQWTGRGPADGRYAAVIKTEDGSTVGYAFHRAQAYGRQFTWTVGSMRNAEGTQSWQLSPGRYKIYVFCTDTLDGIGDTDVPSGTFTVALAQPSVEMTYPRQNPGDNITQWTLGQQQAFRWSTKNIESNVVGFIDLRANNVSYRVADNIRNTGEFSWNGSTSVLGQKVPAGTYAATICFNTYSASAERVCDNPGVRLVASYQPTVPQPVYVPPTPVFQPPVDLEDPGTGGNNCISLTYTLKYRSRDANTNGQVSDLQDFLQNRGHLSQEPTGYFGLATVTAVKQFQSVTGISPTGIVGAVTRAKIQQLSCGVANTSTNKPNQRASIFEQFKAIFGR